MRTAEREGNAYYPDRTALIETERIKVTLGELLGQYASIEDPFHLQASQVEVARFDTAQEAYFSVVFHDTEFAGKKLEKLLTFARPDHGTDNDYKTQSTQQVLDDWNLLDTPQRDYAKKLSRMHQKNLGLYWSEFVEQDLWKYREALASLSAQETREVLDKDIRHVIHEGYAIRNLPKVYSEAFNAGETSIWETEGTHVARQFDLVNDWLASSGKTELQEIQPHELYGQLWLDWRSMIKIAYAMPLAMREKLIKEGILLSEFTLIDENSPLGRLPKHSGGPWQAAYFPAGYYSHAISYQAGNIVVASLNDSFITAKLTSQGNEMRDGFISDGSDKALVPWLVWKKHKTTGEREYLVSGVPSEVQGLSEKVDIRVNTNFGLVVAHTLPRKRVTLPQVIRFGALEQDMGEAQIPLLASMRRNDIVCNKAFTAIEQSLQ